MIKKHEMKKRRAHRTRARIHGTADMPRLSVFRSAKHFSVQMIDDDAAKTIASVNDKEIDAKGKKPVEVAEALGKLMAEKADKAGVKKAVLDRGPFAYHGRVKAFAEGARNAGLTI